MTRRPNPMPSSPPPGFAITEKNADLVILSRPQSPEWFSAAIESLSAYRERTGHTPEAAVIGPRVARDMAAFSGRTDLLLGYPTRIVDDEWHGVDWA